VKWQPLAGHRSPPADISKPPAILASAVNTSSPANVHIAVAKFFLLNQAGAKVENAPSLTQTTEKDVKGKATVIGWLKDSFEAIRRAYPTAGLEECGEIVRAKTIIHTANSDGHCKLAARQRDQGRCSSDSMAIFGVQQAHCLQNFRFNA